MTPTPRTIPGYARQLRNDSRIIPILEVRNWVQTLTSPLTELGMEIVPPEPPSRALFATPLPLCLNICFTSIP